MSDLVIGVIAGFGAGIFAAIAFLYGRRNDREALRKIATEDVGPTDGSAQEILIACVRIALDAIEEDE
jgi:hypothetical protein